MAKVTNTAKTGAPEPAAATPLRVLLQEVTWPVVSALVLMALVVWQVAEWTRRSHLAELEDQIDDTFVIHHASLMGTLERFRVTPRLLADSPILARLLQYPDDETERDAGNRFLEHFNEIIGASDSYVLDLSGLTLAASNWRQTPTFVGLNFGYRPYFQDAAAGADGLFVGLGTTSKTRGFYFSSPVRSDGQVIGVAVVKVGLADLESTWSRGPARIVASDADGVIFLSNREDWRYRTFWPLDQSALARHRETRKYQGLILEPLNVVDVTLRSQGPSRLSVEEPGPGHPEDRKRSDYLHRSETLGGTAWKLHVLQNTHGVGSAIMTAVVLTLFLMAFLTLGALFMLQRARYQNKVQETLQRARDQLEARVAARTSDLEASNFQLRHEISERERAESEARQARDELVQAGKLAALGQLSAGITHELNQPLAAIRAYADNARVFLERGTDDKVDENLQLVSELTEQASGIVEHLKVFARKTSDEIETVPLTGVIDRALTLLAPKFRKDAIEVRTEMPAAEVQVAANAIRLEQVLVNLLSNACDAVRETPRKQVCVRLSLLPGRANLQVGDSGPGISDEALPHLFDPFFTTKEVGKGLGLGLSISYGIVRNFGGSIRAGNGADGGAVFQIELPLAVTREPEGGLSAGFRS